MITFFPSSFYVSNPIFTPVSVKLCEHTATPSGNLLRILYCTRSERGDTSGYRKLVAAMYVRSGTDGRREFLSLYLAPCLEGHVHMWFTVAMHLLPPPPG